MTITSPAGWISLLATAAMLVTAIVWGFYGSIPITADGPGILLHSEGLRSISSLTSGKVTQVRVKDGDIVEKGDVIVRLQPLSTYPETSTVDITSPYGGRISGLDVRVGTVVNTGDLLASVASLNMTLDAILYLAADRGKKVHVGQPAQITVSTVDRQEYGFIYGEVSNVARYSTTQAQMKDVLGNEDLVKLFLSGSTSDGDPSQAAPIEIRVRLYTSLKTPSGYKWSSREGPPFLLSPGTLCTAEIVTGAEHPVDLVVPYLLKRFGAPQQ